MPGVYYGLCQLNSGYSLVPGYTAACYTGTRAASLIAAAAAAADGRGERSDVLCRRRAVQAVQRVV